MMRDHHHTQNKSIKVPFTWHELHDVIYYLEWKCDEINETGNEFEYPEIEDKLAELKNIASRLQTRSEKEYDKMIRNQAKKPDDMW